MNTDSPDKLTVSPLTITNKEKLTGGNRFIHIFNQHLNLDHVLRFEYVTFPAKPDRKKVIAALKAGNKYERTEEETPRIVVHFSNGDKFVQTFSQHPGVTRLRGIITYMLANDLADITLTDAFHEAWDKAIFAVAEEESRELARLAEAAA